MKKRAKMSPDFVSEAKGREFRATHYSSRYVDGGKAQNSRLPNLKPSTRTISRRLPEALFERIKREANKRDVPYQSLIRTWLAKTVDRNSAR